MPKADFEFYEIQGIEGDFVIPKPASDPYGGQVHPKDAEALAISSLSATVEEVTGLPTRVAVEQMSGGSDGLKFFEFHEDAEVLWQRVRIEVDAHDLSNPFRFAPIGMLLRPLSTVASVPLGPKLSEPTEPRAKRVVTLEAIREHEAVFGDTSLMDLDDNPRHPNITINQKIPIRAFRWSAGPVRKRYHDEKDLLLPTYSPRPENVVIAQMVEIVAINPNVANASR